MSAELPACPECGENHPEEVLKCPKTDTALPLAGRLLDGKFRLLTRLGTGGMAQVWLAMNVRVDRNVALKLIRPELVKNDEMLARFRNEARAAGRIGNPHICDILDMGSSSLGPYIVMEQLLGQSLGDLLAQEGKLDAPVAVAIVRQALQGLAAAHEAGIVHRDLKPENVYLHRPDGRASMVKLMDFGVSKFLHGTSEAETAAGVLLGTPQYMSPEQVRGAKDVDERTDIWAVGAILYRALTGKDAFLGPTMAASLLNVAKGDLEPLTKIVPDLPPGLVAVVEKCLERDVAKRWQKAREVYEALEPFSAAGPLPETASSGAAIFGAGTAHETVAAEPTTAVFERDPTTLRVADKASAQESAVQVTQDAPRRPSWRLAALGAAALVLVVGSWAVSRRERTESSRRPDMAESESAAVVAPQVAKAEPAEPASEPGAEAAVDPPPSVAAPGKPADEPVTESPKAIPGTIRRGAWFAATDAPKPATHREAQRYCEGLAASAYLGQTAWELAPIHVATRFADSGLRRGTWWSAAKWQGSAKAVTFPSGATTSSPETKRHRPLCVVKP